MQNSNPLPQEKEFDPIADLIARFKLAYKVLTSKKAMVFVENELVLVNIAKKEAFEISNIIGDSMLELEVKDSNKFFQNLIASA